MYGVYYQLWPLAAPIFVELGLLVALMAMKLVFDNYPARVDGKEQEIEEERNIGQDGEDVHDEGNQCSENTV